MTTQAAIHILDFDSSLLSQKELLTHAWPKPHVHSLGPWGSRIRLACGFWHLRQLMATVSSMLPPILETAVILVGSGDFHHVSLGLVRRLEGPFNLLVLDAHPDWMRGVPFLHCGTWLYHAARLPNVASVYHVGGQTDFDNRFRWLAPWRMLESGKIKVIPAAHQFSRGRWKRTRHQSLRSRPDEPASSDRIETIVRGFRADLAARPLYVSIDKDVIGAAEVMSNWDCGCLTLAETCAVISHFLAAARGRLAGADIVGDWSPVRTQGVIAAASHYLEHPHLEVHPEEAIRLNQRANLALLAALLNATI